MKKDENTKAKKYDFKRPDKFSKDHMRTLCNIHEFFSRLATTTLSGQLKTTASLHVSVVDQLTYEEFIRSIPNPTTMGIIAMNPLRGQAVLEIDPNTTFTIIDRMLGGKGESVKKNRELTGVEIQVMKTIINKMLTKFEKAWSFVVNLDTRLTDIECNPNFVSSVAPNEMVIVITIETIINGVKGLMNLCIPYMTIEPIVRKLQAEYWLSSNDDKKSYNLNIPGKYQKYYDFVIGNMNVDDIINLNENTEIFLSKTAYGKPSYELMSSDVNSLMKYEDVKSVSSKTLLEKLSQEKLSQEKLSVIESVKFPLIIRIKDNMINMSNNKNFDDEEKNINDFIKKSGNLIIGNRIMGNTKILSDEDKLYAKIFDISKSTEKLLNTEVEIEVEVATARLSGKAYKKLTKGSLIPSNKNINDDFLIKINKVPFAYGEVVVIGENYGINVNKVIDENEIETLKEYTSPTSKPELFVRFRLGKTSLKLKDITEIKKNHIIKLDKYAGDPMTVIVNEVPTFNAEIIIFDDMVSARITRIIGLEDEETEPSYYEIDTENKQEAKIDYSDYKASFSFLEDIDIDLISKMFAEEHPQTLALIVSNIKPDISSKLVASLPTELKVDVVERIANLDKVSAEVMYSVEKVLKQKVSQIELVQTKGGIDTVVDMLNFIDRKSEKDIILSLEKTQPELAEKIKNKLFIFEDIVLLSDADIQKALRNIDYPEMAMALKGVDSEVQEKIFKNQSEKAMEKLKSKMKELGPVRLRDVEENQLKFIEVIKALEEKGEIQITRIGEDNIVN